METEGNSLIEPRYLRVVTLNLINVVSLPVHNLEV